MDLMETLLIGQYVRIRYGKVERVREHQRRPWRWYKRLITDKRN